jgi:hypothetical protein
VHTSGDFQIRVHTFVVGKAGRIIMVCLFVCLFVCCVFDDTLISNTEYLSRNDRSAYQNGKDVAARCRALILDITQEFVGKEREQPRKTSVNIVGVTVKP